jgi:hypothetical protein
MAVAFDYLEILRRQHPGWRLLSADSAPFVASLLHRVFVEGNHREISETELVDYLEDAILDVRASIPDAFPKAPRQYLVDWSHPDRGWLRRFYPKGSDEPFYDITPGTEKALQWLASLSEGTFVGTESRLLTVLDLLRQMVEGAEEDPEERIQALMARRKELDDEIARVRAGDIRVLDDTAQRDRFQQVATTAQDLLGDFRQVEANFRSLDRSVRKRIAGWDESRGALLEEVFGETDQIADSDQGVSFRAFFDLLMSSQRQQELSDLLEAAMNLPAVRGYDSGLSSILHDWLVAGDSAQRTVAQLSQQLRRFLDDKTYLENRRIVSLLRSIEKNALEVQDRQPTVREFLSIPAVKSDVSLPMERPLYSRPPRVDLTNAAVELGDEDFETPALFAQIHVDPAVLRGHIAARLAEHNQTTVGDTVRENPLDEGLAELVTYLNIADADDAAFASDETEQVSWIGADGLARSARIPQIVFVRDSLLDKAEPGADSPSEAGGSWRDG